MAFTTIVTFFMFFFFRRISISFESVLTLFFLLQKDFDTFYKRLFKAFLCFLIMSREHFLHLWKNYLIGFYRSINRFEYKPLKIAWNHFNHLNQQSFQSALHTLCEKCSNTEFFFVHIFCIWTEYRKIWAIINSVFGHFSRSDKSCKLFDYFKELLKITCNPLKSLKNYLNYFKFDIFLLSKVWTSLNKFE